MEKLSGKFYEKLNIIQSASAVFMSLLIILGVLFSSVEITEELHHHCHNDSCHICYTINLAKSYINGLHLGENIFYYVLISVLSIGAVKIVNSLLTKAVTLVSLKVKLSN